MASTKMKQMQQSGSKDDGDNEDNFVLFPDMSNYL